MGSKSSDEKTTGARTPICVAVVGASGVVGQETVSILSERRFPISELLLFASKRSAGETVKALGSEYVIEELTEEGLARADLVFFAAGGAISKAYAPKARAHGAICIDKSSVFRMDKSTPLVVPEVNGHVLDDVGPGDLVATPNCSTIQLVQVLKPLGDKSKIKRVVVSTYQAVSGAGKAGIDELETQVRDMFNFREVKTDTFGNRIAFNALAAIPGKDAFNDDGYSMEERKMMDETKKILELPDLKISATCVRVPVFNSHSEAVNITFDWPVTPEAARETLAAADNIVVVDDPKNDLYPTPTDAAGEDNTLVGRIRTDESDDNALALWCVSDNLRTGAALNAVRIAEALIARGAFRAQHEEGDAA